MFNRENLIYMAAGAGIALAYSRWRNQQRLQQFVHPHALPAPAQAPMAHPRQRGLIPVPVEVKQPIVTTAPMAPPPALTPPPVGAGAPPADAGVAGIPNSHDIVQTPYSPHVNARTMPAPPPPAQVMPMSQDPYEIAPGIGPVELQGF